MRAVLQRWVLLLCLCLAIAGCGDGEEGGVDDTGVAGVEEGDHDPDVDDEVVDDNGAAGDDHDEEDTETERPTSSLEVTGQTPASEVEIRVAELLTELEAAPEPEGATVEISDTVLFDFDSSELKAEAAPILSDVAEVLTLLEDAPAQIRGHTDNVGTTEYNLGLSQERADAVRDFLVDAGVDPALISTEGVGPNEPVADNETDEGRAQNRRVEIILPTVDLDDFPDA